MNLKYDQARKIFIISKRNIFGYFQGLLFVQIFEGREKQIFEKKYTPWGNILYDKKTKLVLDFLMVHYLNKDSSKAVVQLK